MFIQEIFQLADDDIVEAVTCAIQYALHSTILQEQYLDDFSLNRFRERNTFLSKHRKRSYPRRDLILCPDSL